MSTSTPAKPDPKNHEVLLVGVRLSYPNLFKPMKSKDRPDEPGKFSASFILDKEKDKVQIAAINAKINAILAENNKGAKIAPDKLCLRDGSFKPDKEGYSDAVVFITASNARRPRVVDKKSVRDANGKFVDIEPGDPRIFGGCYVNAVVRLWWQDNKEGGKRVNGSLESVQYVKEGEPFGSAPVDADEAFADVPDDEDAVDPALLD